MPSLPPVDVPAWTSTDERLLLARLAQEVPAQGLILEIGCLYGGTTAVLALSNLLAKVVSIDDFSWTPEGYPAASKALFLENMQSIKAQNVSCIEGDSRLIAKEWDKNIDLLWIDGGHSFEYVYSDLFNFSKFAKVIALHDYKNPAWETVEKAVEIFLNAEPGKWRIDKIVGMICVLKRS